MQHSSAPAASLATPAWLLPWAGQATLAQARACFASLGYCCVRADRQAGYATPPLTEEADTSRRSADPAGFLIRRTIARALAAEILCLAPEQVRITADAGGAPRLEGSSLFLSFSARGDVGLIALGTTALGVDYETALPPAGIPSNILREDERALLAPLPPVEAEMAFLSLWRAKEAALKAVGLGFALPPEAVRIHGGRASIAGQPHAIALHDVPGAGITLALLETG